MIPAALAAYGPELILVTGVLEILRGIGRLLPRMRMLRLSIISFALRSRASGSRGWPGAAWSWPCQGAWQFLMTPSLRPATHTQFLIAWISSVRVGR
jgi:hypothetical protein